MNESIRRALYIACGNGLCENLGGSLVRSVEIAKRLIERKIDVYFLTTLGGWKAAKNKGLKASYHILPASLFGKESETNLGDRVIAYLVSSMASIARVRKLPDVDVVYTDSDYFCDIIPGALYKRAHPGTKWFAMIHHLIGLDRTSMRDRVITALSQTFQERCWKIVCKYADGVMVYDTEMGDVIKDHIAKTRGYDAAKVYSVTNGIEMETIMRLPERDKIYDAVMVGGLRPNKGLYDIIPIWKRVVSHVKHARLGIVGGSAYASWLGEEIRREGLIENILVLGNKSHRDVLDILKSAKVYMTPSREEGWGIAVCEALACNLPVVAYDLPAYRKTFGDHIDKVPVGEIGIFADKVVEVLLGPLSNSEESRKAVSQYDWEIVADRELKIFDHIT